MNEILSDLKLLEEADQLCIAAATSLTSNQWLLDQIDSRSFDIEKYKLYSRKMGGARLQPQEKCKALDAGLQKLSKRSRDMLDDGSTVQEIYFSLQTELYRNVWRYHLCLCEDEEGAKPYFDRLDEQQTMSLKKKVTSHVTASNFIGCSTKALFADLQAICQLKTFVVSSNGFALHDASNGFTSHTHLMQTVKNIFDCFDPFRVSREFSVPDEVCAQFHKNLPEMRRAQNLLLADILDQLSEQASGALKKSSFSEVENLWFTEIERRNVELEHFS